MKSVKVSELVKFRKAFYWAVETGLIKMTADELIEKFYEIPEGMYRAICVFSADTSEFKVGDEFICSEPTMYEKIRLIRNRFSADKPNYSFVPIDGGVWKFKVYNHLGEEYTRPTSVTKDQYAESVDAGSIIGRSIADTFFDGMLGIAQSVSYPSHGSSDTDCTCSEEQPTLSQVMRAVAVPWTAVGTGEAPPQTIANLIGRTSRTPR